MSRPIITRFAPSPTGHLHVGNIRMALFNWLYAKKAGGQFILRIDDTDTARSTKEFEDAIKEDMNWLGLTWDRTENQSARLALYEKAAEKLRADGRLYACYETPEELEYMRRRQRARGKPPVYDRSALSLTDEQIKAYEDEGRKPHWRFKQEEDVIRWNDLGRGDCHVDPAHVSDPVLIREDGSFLYMLPSTLDDAEFGVTHVIRGEDHVTNTAMQIQLFKALDADIPVFGHMPLMTGADGKLSKRGGALSIRDIRADGIEPMALLSLLTRLGSADSLTLATEVTALSEAFDLAHYGRAQPLFTPGDLPKINAQIMHNLSYDEMAPWLKEKGFEISESFFETIRPNLEKRSDIDSWCHICQDRIDTIREDDEMLTEAAALLPTSDWDETTWKAWTTAVKEKTGRKGKGLFMPLRLALTGLDHGPEMAKLLPLIGPEKAKRRLIGA